MRSEYLKLGAPLASLVLVSICAACDDGDGLGHASPIECDAGKHHSRDASQDRRVVQDTSVAPDTSVVREDARHDAPSDVLQHDAAGSLGANTCRLDVDGGTGVWPSSTSNAAPKCIPNCGVSECGGTCEKGALPTPVMACDTGCCEANDAFSKSMGTLRSSTVATSPSGKVYFAGVSWLAEFVYAATNDPTVNSWPEGATLDPPVTTTGGGSSPRSSGATRLAFGNADGRDAVYVEYAYDPLSVRDPAPRLRFGVQAGSTWTFEDLPSDPSGLASDAGGAALVLLNDRILRRKATGGWDSVPLPAALVAPGQFAERGDHLAVDDRGAWYVLRSNTEPVVRIGRRDPDGSWAVECIPIDDRVVPDSGKPIVLDRATIAVGAGTVHVAYSVTSFSTSVSAYYSGIFYARRSGSTWIQEEVAGMNPGAFALAIDSCGTPHVVASGSGGSTNYIRWTSAGWRQTVFDAMGTTILSLSLTSDFALVGNGSTFVRIPKR